MGTASGLSRRSALIAEWAGDRVHSGYRSATGGADERSWRGPG